MLLITVLGVYVVVETAVQLVLGGRSGVWTYLSDFREAAKKQGLGLDEYGRQVGVDAYVGWGKMEQRTQEPPANRPASGTLLIIGDSVTQGFGVRGGVEDYPALLAATLGAERGFRVVNLAVSGYGVDQMWLKLLLTAERYHPDAIVFAYIPHDLIRPANDFSFGLPKPKFVFSGSKVDLQLAAGIKAYHGEYDNARSGWRLSGWYAGYYWNNKEYYMPSLFTGYYGRLYQHIGEGLAGLSAEMRIPVVVAKLTNRKQFAAVDQLTALAAAEFARPALSTQADVRYFDTDACVLPKATAQGVDIEQEFAHHPGIVGHRLLAECLGSYLEPVLSQLKAH